MNTNISREELYENFVTKEYLHTELNKINKKIDEAVLDFRSMVMDISNILNGKIMGTESRFDQHLMQNALEHSKLFKKA